MPKPKQNKPTVGARSFKRSGEGFTPIEVGEEIRGKFVRVRSFTMKDRQTGEQKPRKAYELTLADGSTVSIAGRALLDGAFEDVFAVIPADKLSGQEISIIRGEDVESEYENPMQTFEVLVWDKSTF